jgi:CRISPR-associated endonuclease Csn1
MIVIIILILGTRLFRITIAMALGSEQTLPKTKGGPEPASILWSCLLVNGETTLFSMLTAEINTFWIVDKFFIARQFAFLIGVATMKILRFAFDVGTNSIGWAVLRGDKDSDAPQGGIIKVSSTEAIGARIFSDGRNPKDGSSLAMMRREPRAARKRRDRFLQRQRKVMAQLIANGLMPMAEGERKRLEHHNPYELRANALDHKLEPYQIGRIIFHMNQRRGFQSNRKADKADKDTGVLKQAQKRLDEALQRDGSRTLGEFLHKRLNAGDHARFRITGTGPKAEHEFFPTRQLAKDEFAKIWDAQSHHHSALLTEDAKLAISNALFHQRKLKPVKAGRCTFNPSEERMSAAMPSVEARRIYQDVNELRYGEGLDIKTTLTPVQRDALVSTLLMGNKISWDKLRASFKLQGTVRFSIEETRDELKGCATAAILRGKKGRELFGKEWHGLSLERKDEIAAKLIETEDEAEVIAWLVTETGVSAETAEMIAGTNLPDGHGRLGPTANAAILAQLRDHHDYTYAKAAEAAGYHHSDFSTDAKLDRLPYYAKVLERHVSFGTGNPDDGEEKQFGKFANPTVHIGLNQIRKLVNRLIEKYGKPDEVVIELARELKQSKKQKDEDQKRNKKNKETNERLRRVLAEHGLPDNAGNMARLRLWEEQQDGLHAFCPYSGEQISFAQLFTDEIEIDHILPFSRTLDDGAANKVACFRSSNRGKGNRTPFEHFGTNQIWEAIAGNAQRLPRNKRWRFAPDAMEKFKTENRDFLDRQLNETRHLARVAKTYLERVSPQVWVVTGQLTAMLRGKWGLNSILSDDNRKNRGDHRHHAIDAFTIGCMDRGLLNELAKRAGQAEDRGDERIIADVPEPFEGYRDQLRDLARTMIVSHKPDHGKDAALHEETAYGIVCNEKELEIGNLVYRKSIGGLTESEIDRVRDEVLRKKLQAVRDGLKVEDKKIDAKALSAALIGFADSASTEEAQRTGRPRNPIRHVRILKPEASNVEILNRQTGAPYKAVVPGQNWCMDIVSVRDGKGGFVWRGFAVTIFEVNRKDWRPQWERDKIGGKLVMRLHKGDLVEIDDKDGIRRVKRVVRINPSANRVFLSGHNDAGNLQDRHNDGDDQFRWDLAGIGGMQERKATKLRVNEIGNKHSSVG